MHLMERALHFDFEPGLERRRRLLPPATRPAPLFAQEICRLLRSHMVPTTTKARGGALRLTDVSCEYGTCLALDAFSSLKSRVKRFIMDAHVDEPVKFVRLSARDDIDTALIHATAMRMHLAGACRFDELVYVACRALIASEVLRSWMQRSRAALRTDSTDHGGGEVAASSIVSHSGSSSTGIRPPPSLASTACTTAACKAVGSVRPFRKSRTRDSAAKRARDMALLGVHGLSV